MKVVWANLKKLRFTDKKKFYKLLIKEYGEEYELFFKYLKKNWISKKFGKV